MKKTTAALALAVVAIIVVGAVAILYVVEPRAQSASSNTQSASSSSGQVALLISDPPIAPKGVTDLYMTYTNVAIHESNETAPAGWLTLGGSGTVELFATQNISLTIGTGKVPFGNYNRVRFVVSSGEVTYEGANYTANFRQDNLTVLVVGGIHVNSTQGAAAIMDISPLIVNWGTSNNPVFLVSARAIALPVPLSNITPQMLQIGFRFALAERAWFNHELEAYTSNLGVTGASLSSTGVTLGVKNTGNASTLVKAVVISPLVGSLRPATSGRIVPILVGSLTFAATDQGQLIPITVKTFTNSNASLIPSELGYNLTVGGSYSFSYTGAIQLGFGLTRGLEIVPGQQYLVTVLGDQAIASYVVTAS